MDNFHSIFNPDNFGPFGRIYRHQKGAKKEGPSASQLALEKTQLELSRKQLANMEAEANKPTPAAPPPLASLPPAATQSSADTEQAAAEARRASLKRMAPGRSTIFAGQSKNMLGSKTLLG